MCSMHLVHECCTVMMQGNDEETCCKGWPRLCQKRYPFFIRSLHCLCKWCIVIADTTFHMHCLDCLWKYVILIVYCSKRQATCSCSVGSINSYWTFCLQLLEQHFGAAMAAVQQKELEIAKQHAAAVTATVNAVAAYAEWAPVASLANYGLTQAYVLSHWIYQIYHLLLYIVSCTYKNVSYWCSLYLVHVHYMANLFCTKLHFGIQWSLL